MTDITIYSAQGCAYCQAAERLLRNKGIEQFNKIRVDVEDGRLEEMIERSGRRTVPQIFIGNFHVGGFDDLSRLDRAGQLDGLLGF